MVNKNLRRGRNDRKLGRKTQYRINVYWVHGWYNGGGPGSGCYADISRGDIVVGRGHSHWGKAQAVAAAIAVVRDARKQHAT